jgi:hypothetical protein
VVFVDPLEVRPTLGNAEAHLQRLTPTRRYCSRPRRLYPTQAVAESAIAIPIRSQTNPAPADAPEPTADPIAESGLFEVDRGAEPVSELTFGDVPLTEPVECPDAPEALFFCVPEGAPPAAVRSRMALPAFPWLDSARWVERLMAPPEPP